MIENDYSLVDNAISNYTENDETDLFDVFRYRRFHCYNKIDEVIYSIENINPLAEFYHILKKSL